MKPLHPAVRTVWTLQYVIWTITIVSFVFVYDLLRFLGGRTDLIPPGGLTFLVLIGGIAACVLLPRLRYRFWRYDLRPDELYLERGILNRIRTIVPLRRIQHLDVSQNVIEREFELGKLIVHTAGARNTDVVLPGLLMEDAEHLRDQLKHYILDDAV
jgi:uncharacterized protein